MKYIDYAKLQVSGGFTFTVFVILTPHKNIKQIGIFII